MLGWVRLLCAVRTFDTLPACHPAGRNLGSVSQLYSRMLGLAELSFAWFLQVAHLLPDPSAIPAPASRPVLAALRRLLCSVITDVSAGGTAAATRVCAKYTDEAAAKLKWECHMPCGNGGILNVRWDQTLRISCTLPAHSLQVLAGAPRAARGHGDAAGLLQRS